MSKTIITKCFKNCICMSKSVLLYRNGFGTSVRKVGLDNILSSSGSGWLVAGTNFEMIHWPKTRNDTILFAVFWFGGVYTIFYESCIVLGSYHDKWNGYVTFHAALLLFLALQIYINMLLLISSDVTAKNIAVPDGDPPPGWKYCQKCQRNAPPRSHHCKYCDECILKRDHHCWFAGYCIGYSNHCYFFCLVFYASLAGIYANIYNWEFFLTVKGGFAWTTLPALLAPHMGIMLGVYSWYELFITVSTSTGAFFTFFFVWLLVLQVLQLCSGQVKHERRKQIFDYSRGFAHTFNEIFGSAGLWLFLCPLIPTKFPGDGTYFFKSEKKSE